MSIKFHKSRLSLSLLNPKVLVSLATATLLFTGCGGGGGGSTPPADTTQTAYLIDSAVEGVTYTTPSRSGVTRSDGGFDYNPTDTTITFTIGSLKLADFNLSNLNSDARVLPADLAGVDRNDTSHPNLLKLLRVFQALDENNNPSDGITITDNTKGHFGVYHNLFDTNLTTLEALMPSGKPLVTEQKAKNHYKTTLTTLGVTPVKRPFITVWDTNATDRNITIPINPNYSTYNYTVDWGDGTIEHNRTTSANHIYQTDGNQTVKISGEFPAIFMDDAGINQDNKQLQAVSAWGDIEWKDFNVSFAGCSNLQFTATDTPDLTNVTNMSLMFALSSFNQPLNNWDVSNVPNMSGMFMYSSFNQPLNNWDVSNVTNMSYMFGDATAFNQPLNNWDVSDATDMSYMFGDATAFNQPLNNWDVSNVTNMSSMFGGATAFNQPLNNWDVSNVTNMSWMFYDATAFTNQDLSSWNISKTSHYSSFMSQAGSGNSEPNWVAPTRSGEIVTDSTTGLMWQDNAEANTTQKQWITTENYNSGDYNNTIGDTATTYCTNLQLGVYSDWRLPTHEELGSIVYVNSSGNNYPKIKLGFANTASDYYWSSTTIAGYTDYAWVVDFNDGYSNTYYKTYSYYVRCVRGGQ